MVFLVRWEHVGVRWGYYGGRLEVSWGYIWGTLGLHGVYVCDMIGVGWG